MMIIWTTLNFGQWATADTDGRLGLIFQLWTFDYMARIQYMRDKESLVFCVTNRGVLDSFERPHRIRGIILGDIIESREF
jgi:hypothetical protein